MSQTLEVPLRKCLDLSRFSPRPFTAYPHQAGAWDAMDRHYLRGQKQSGVVIVPTGGGKTQLAARWLLQNWVASGKRVLWLSHRRGLLVQAFDTFEQGAALAAAGALRKLHLILVSGQDFTWSRVADEDQVIFATMQSSATDSAQGFLKRLAGQNLFVVVDEAHHITAPSYRRVLDTLNRDEIRLLGLTATPTRMIERERRQLWSLLGEPVFEIQKQDLIASGILASPVLVTVETHCEFESEFTDAEIDHLKRFGELAESVLRKIGGEPRRNRLIVEHYREHAGRYGKTLVFAVDIAHAITLTEEFKAQGIEADYVASNRDDNQQVMARYLDPEGLQVLINVEMLTEGFDSPKTQAVFLARPTRSEALISQMVGRALRGPQAQGTLEAFIVGFRDEWREFDFFHTSWDPEPGTDLDSAIGAPSGARGEPLPVPVELILEAYKLVQSRVRGELLGAFECFPERWYTWSQDTSEGVVDRRVLVLNHQLPGFKRLRDEFNSEPITGELDDQLVDEVIARCFHDCPDPQPRGLDILDLLRAWRANQSVSECTFEEKARFDPYLVAERIYRLPESEQQRILHDVWEAEPVCRGLFGSFRYFFEEVAGHGIQLRIRDLPSESGGEEPPPPPLPEPRAWPPGEKGYDLFELKDTLLALPDHEFRGHAPDVNELEYSDKPMPGYWGWCTPDGRIRMNCVLNSPDFPRYVVEFVLYHELLHAAMPHAGHNRDFRVRERKFVPSKEALQEAERQGHKPAASPDAWRVLAEQFLDTFERRHSMPGRGWRM